MNSPDNTHNPMILPITYCHRAIGFDKIHACIPSPCSRLNTRIETNAVMNIAPAAMQ